MWSMGRQAASGSGAGRSTTGAAGVSTSMLSVISIELAGPNSRAVSCRGGEAGRAESHRARSYVRRSRCAERRHGLARCLRSRQAWLPVHCFQSACICVTKARLWPGRHIRPRGVAIQGAMACGASLTSSPHLTYTTTWWNTLPPEASRAALSPESGAQGGRDGQHAVAMLHFAQAACMNMHGWLQTASSPGCCPLWKPHRCARGACRCRGHHAGNPRRGRRCRGAGGRLAAGSRQPCRAHWRFTTTLTYRRRQRQDGGSAGREKSTPH